MLTCTLYVLGVFHAGTNGEIQKGKYFFIIVLNSSFELLFVKRHVIVKLLSALLLLS